MNVHTLDGKPRVFDNVQWEVTEGCLWMWTKRANQWDVRQFVAAYPLTSIERWTGGEHSEG